MRAIVKPEPTSPASDSVTRRPERPIGWSVDDSAELYQVNAWGKGYFCVNPSGHLVVSPDMNAERGEKRGPVRHEVG